MKKVISIALLLFSVLIVNSSPRISFKDLLAASELNPQFVLEAKNFAMNKGLPVTVYTIDRVIMDAKAIEDGKVIYAVFTDLLDVYNGGYAAYYEEIVFKFDASTSRMDFGRGRVVDNTHGMYDPVVNSSSAADQYLMIVGWSLDKVYLLSAQNGDIVDTNFIPPSNPQLQSPKTAMQHFSGRYIIVSDQVSDVVQKFDTTGSYIGFYAPSSGPNTSIVDNMRGIRYRPNGNLLITVASGASSNTIQQFDTGGVHIGAFITGNISSPFDIIYRTSDILISNSSGNDVVRFDLNGTFLSIFHNSSNISFAQQMLLIPGGRIAVSGFSAPNSGLTLLDADGNYIRTMSAITGNRGVYLLGNGHYLVTNSTGAHEIDSASGSLIRSILVFGDLQYIAPYTPGWLLSNGNNQNSLPEGFSLAQNYPNPFNPSTVIKYALPKASDIRLSVFDITGREVSVLFTGKQEAGEHEVTFEAKGFASGIYYYKLEVNGYSEVKKMALIK